MEKKIVIKGNLIGCVSISLLFVFIYVMCSLPYFLKVYHHSIAIQTTAIRIVEQIEDYNNWPPLKKDIEKSSLTHGGYGYEQHKKYVQWNLLKYRNTSKLFKEYPITKLSENFYPSFLSVPQLSKKTKYKANLWIYYTLYRMEYGEVEGWENLVPLEAAKKYAKSKKTN